ncbi:MAG: Ldh family oxidoreductase [Candidatus Solibacter usitatus]|nr:Ldh family oxidoreductase [Candidatus Solibacter usitatus]
MAEQYILIAAQELRAYALRMIEGVGVTPPQAALLADSLLEANLRGVDSHGMQLLNFYIEHMQMKCMDLTATGSVVSESGGTMLYDGGNGIGQVVSDLCCDHVIRLAQANGMALVSVRNSNHFGAAAYWAQKIARAGLIGMAFCNASPLAPPWQGKEPRLGTNPICMAMPGAPETGWLLDMATTTVAMGKIFKAYFSGEPAIPTGWAFDADGVQTTDTAKAFKGMPMPLGGYKGYGLAMMVEILVSVLSGGAMSTEVGGVRIRTRPMAYGHAFIGIDVARFMPLDEFAQRMEHLVGMMKSSQPAPGFDEVLVAGEPEWRSKRKRLVDGIPLSKGVWAELEKTARLVNVTPPVVQEISL